MKWIFQRFFSPYSTVRHGPDSVCGMLRTGCATSSGFTVRHAPDYAPITPECELSAQNLKPMANTMTNKTNRMIFVFFFIYATLLPFAMYWDRLELAEVPFLLARPCFAF